MATMDDRQPYLKSIDFPAGKKAARARDHKHERIAEHLRPL
jgi:hypothetical protein